MLYIIVRAHVLPKGREGHPRTHACGGRDLRNPPAMRAGIGSGRWCGNFTSEGKASAKSWWSGGCEKV